MHLLKDIIDFIKTLTFVDYVFFFAVIILLVLIIALIYFIKSNNEVFKGNNKDSNDLLEITQKMQEEKPRIEFTAYEKDQEEKAIISYDELVQKSNVGKINYDEEQDLDGLSVKKISLESSKEDVIDEQEPKETSIRVISYQNEEKFLLALKELQRLLN